MDARTEKSITGLQLLIYTVNENNDMRDPKLIIFI